MRRIIKFRAWHTGQKRMFSAEEMGRDQLTLSPDGRGFVNVHSTSPRLSQYYDDMIPLEFTGFCDEGGREIYEGDLLHFCDGYEEYTQVVYMDYGSWSVAMWNGKTRNDLQDGWSVNPQWSREPLVDFIDESRVVGNAFEGATEVVFEEVDEC